MSRYTEALTTSEAALAAGVSVREINRAIDEHILPDSFLEAAGTRRLRADACLLIAFYFSAADVLTADARLRTIRTALAHGSDWEEWRHWSVSDNLLTVRFGALWEAVDGRIRELAAARELVVKDEEILSGTPVIRGTRIPAHDVAALLERGTAMEQVLATYPALTARQVELAVVYAKASPLLGRPRRLVRPQGAQVVTVRRRLLKARTGQQAL